MSSWFRVHVGMCEDVKLRAVSRNATVPVTTVIAFWLALLDDAASPSHRGTVTRPLSLFSIALELDVADLQRMLEQFKAMGMASGDDQLQIVNWSKRQFETDQRDPTNATRQKRYRERQRLETQTDATVTRNGKITERNTQNRAEQNIDARTREVARSKWGTTGDLLIAKVGSEMFDRKFGPCILKAGPPVEIEAPTRLWCDELAKKYGQQVAEALGHEAKITWRKAA